MKKLLYLSFVFIASLCINTQSFANEIVNEREPLLTTEISPDDVERAKILNERLEEIKEMDKSTLTSAERKELRSEVKMIKEELAQISGGVYLSIGAIIIILLLLILLL